MVYISDVNKMFWGVTIDAGKRYSQTVQQGFHVSMAALEISTKKPSENVQVMLQRDSTEYLLCTLHNNLLQQPLDLNFATGEEVSFSLNGAGVVHLTGYLIFDDEPSVSEFSDDEEAPSPVDSSGDRQMIGLKRKAASPASNSKKIKLLDEFDDDDDDEDDEDYSEEEEGFSEDDDDDSEDDDSFFNESFDDEDDSDDDEEEVVSPKKIGKAEKTPAKSPTAAATPAKQKKIKQEAYVSKQEKTPKQQGSAKQNGKAQKLNTSTPAQQKQPETPATPSGETESAKKKKKKKKKKNKSENDSMNISNSSSPGTPAATPNSPATPNKSDSTPSGTAKKKVVAGGTLVEDLKAGHGPEAKPGKMVSVYYVGTLAKTNKRFDSCTDGKPFRFRLNQGEVIKGWDVGLNGMKVGGKRKITIPPSQGYGNSKQGPIPPNSTLVFEVELKAVS